MTPLYPAIQLGCSNSHIFLDLRRPIPGNGLIVQFTGPTGTGKGALSKELMNRIPGSEFLVTCTTRERRPGEVHGRHYWFLSEEEFDRCLSEGGFIETHTFVTGKRYGTLLNRVCEQMDKGGIIISDINVDGVSHMRKKDSRLPGNVLDLFIMPPGESLEQQLATCRQRAEDSPDKRDDLEQRLIEAAKEIARKDEFTHVIVNDNFQTAFKEILKIVIKTRTEQFLRSEPCAV